MEHSTQTILGMKLEVWKFKSCVAQIAEFPSVATVYSIGSKEQGKGHATELLNFVKGYYEGQGKKFGGSVALNPIMFHIYKKLGIHEYN